MLKFFDEIAVTLFQVIKLIERFKRKTILLSLIEAHTYMLTGFAKLFSDKNVVAIKNRTYNKQQFSRTVAQQKACA